VRLSDCEQGIEPYECKGKGHRLQRLGFLGCFSLVKERKKREKRVKRVRSQEVISEFLVGNLSEGYKRNVPLPRVPRDQSTFQSRVPPVHAIPVYYEEKHVISTYNSTCRIGERVATANPPQWQPIAINT